MVRADFGYLVCAVVLVSVLSSVSTTLLIFYFHQPGLYWKDLGGYDGRCTVPQPKQERPWPPPHSEKVAKEPPIAESVEEESMEEESMEDDSMLAELHPSKKILEDAQATDQKRASSKKSRSPRLFGPVEKGIIDEMHTQGIHLVNTGKHKEAILLFNALLKKYPDEYVSLVGRGSAYSLSRNLKLAVEDFSAAIEIEPNVAEAYKRRGQTRGALKDYDGADSDLTVAIKKDRSDFDNYLQRGLVRSSALNYKKAVSDLKYYIKHDKQSALAYQTLGQAYVSLGYSQKAIKAYRRANALKPDSHVLKAAGDAAFQLADKGLALSFYDKSLALKPVIPDAYIGIITVLYDTGDMKKLIRTAKTSCTALEKMGKSYRYQYHECVYILGMAYHSRGKIKKALHYYGKVLQGDEHHRAFYSQYLGRYHLQRIDDDVTTFDIDREIPPAIKEGMTTHMSPAQLDRDYVSGADAADIVAEGPAVLEQRSNGAEIKIIADFLQSHFPSVLQLNEKGFFSNPRQHRQAGLALLEISQSICNALPHNAIDWRQLFGISIRWRQLVSVNDSVWWINGMDQWRELSSTDGFGLSTPLVSGSLQVVRYFPYFKRAFKATKKLLLEQYALSPNATQKIERATTLRGLYNVLNRNFWVTVLLKAGNNSSVEGTRLVLQSKENGNFEYMIRTPGTPKRWKLYEQILDQQFSEFAELWKYCNGNKTLILEEKEKIIKKTLKIFFYWVNFAPLARGSAATGYTALFGLLLSFGLKLKNAMMPKGFQADWEAMLDPEGFISTATSRWMRADQVEFVATEHLPLVSDNIRTFRDMYRAINTVEKKKEELLATILR